MAEGVYPRAFRFGIEVKAPSEGKQQTRVKWMTKQLGKAPPDALLHVHWDQRKRQSQARVAELTSNPLCLTRDTNGELLSADVLPKSFSVEWTQDLQKGRGRAVVLDGIMGDLERFYALVVESIVAFVPRAPKMPVAVVAEHPTEPQEVCAEPEPPAESGEIPIRMPPKGTAARTSPPAPGCPPPSQAVNE